ncbi:hypothetical protein D3C81_2104700 [compost metagenome]
MDMVVKQYNVAIPGIADDFVRDAVYARALPVTGILMPGPEHWLEAHAVGDINQSLIIHPARWSE